MRPVLKACSRIVRLSTRTGHDPPGTPDEHRQRSLGRQDLDGAGEQQGGVRHDGDGVGVEQHLEGREASGDPGRGRQRVTALEPVRRVELDRHRDALGGRAPDPVRVGRRAAARRRRARPEAAGDLVGVVLEDHRAGERAQRVDGDDRARHGARASREAAHVGDGARVTSRRCHTPVTPTEPSSATASRASSRGPAVAARTRGVPSETVRYQARRLGALDLHHGWRPARAARSLLRRRRPRRDDPCDAQEVTS